MFSADNLATLALSQPAAFALKSLRLQPLTLFLLNNIFSFNSIQSGNTLHLRRPLIEFIEIEYLWVCGSRGVRPLDRVTSYIWERGEMGWDVFSSVYWSGEGSIAPDLFDEFEH